MNKLIIFGGSGIGMIAASVAHDLGNWEVLGFLNDAEKTGNTIGKFGTIPVIGKTEDYIKYLNKKDHFFFLAYVGMQNEEQVFQKLLSLNIPEGKWATLIHPTSIIPKGFCKIGSGVLLSPLSQLSPDTEVSDNCILLPNSFLGHDSFMDKFSHLAANAVVGANVHIGKAVHIGTNATIREKIKIGDFSLIGSGSVVLKGIPENTIVAGNPARILRSK